MNMKTLYESILDNEDDILDDTDGITGLNAAKTFMKHYFPGWPGEAGYLVDNILLMVLLNYENKNNTYEDPVTDEEYDEFSNVLNGGNIDGGREFLRFLKRIYVRDNRTWGSFGVGSLGDCKLYPEFSNKLFKSNAANLKKIQICFPMDYQNNIKDIVKNSTEFVISDNTADMEEFYIFSKPKYANDVEKKFIDELFKYIK